MIAQSLSLPSVGFASVAAPGQTVITSASTHAVRIALDQPASAWFATDAVAVAPGTPSVLVIIGRDVLMQCRLLFDGPGKAFRLRF